MSLFTIRHWLNLVILGPMTQQPGLDCWAFRIKAFKPRMNNAHVMATARIGLWQCTAAEMFFVCILLLITTPLSYFLMCLYFIQCFKSNLLILLCSCV